MITVRAMFLLILMISIPSIKVWGQLAFDAEIGDSTFQWAYNGTSDLRKVLKIKISNSDTSNGYFLPAINMNFAWMNMYDFNLQTDYNQLTLTPMNRVFSCPDSIEVYCAPFDIKFSIKRAWFCNALIKDETMPNQNIRLNDLSNRLAYSYESHARYVGTRLSNEQCRLAIDTLNDSFIKSSAFLLYRHCLDNGLLIPPSSSVEMLVFIEFIACLNKNELTLLLDFKTDNRLPKEVLGYLNFQEKVELKVKK